MGIRETLSKNHAYIALSQWKHRVMARLSPRKASCRLWKDVHGFELRWENPEWLGEKLMRLKVEYYFKSPLVRKLANKYLVQDYVRACGCGDTLKTCYGAWDSIDEIPWDTLPDRYVLKSATGCGANVFYDNKSTFDTAAAVEKLRQAEKNREYLYYCELQYTPGPENPQKYICEQMLKRTEAGSLPSDYKIYCFFGEPRAVEYCCDRREIEGARLSFFDADWNPLQSYMKEPGELVPPPASWEQMKEYARKLAKPFPFVRVDFFEEDGKPVFGEMTFTPGGCLMQFHSEEGQLALGRLLDLSRVDAETLR